MGIPSLQINGELPPGEHTATLDEIEAVYGCANDRRKLLMRGLREAATLFANAGIKTLWVNGSFVTDKDMPNDIDGCWEYSAAVTIDKLDPVFLPGGHLKIPHPWPGQNSPPRAAGLG